MKNSIFLLVIMFTIVILSGCGETGTNGVAPASPPSAVLPAGTEEKKDNAGTTEEKNDDVGTEAPPAITPPEKNKEEAISTGIGAAAPSPSEQQTVNKDTDHKVSIDYIKNHLKMDMTQDQVEALFGAKYTEVTNAMEGNMMWRYDLGAKPGYSYSGEMDSVDLEGLNNQSITIQLFIDWSEDNDVDHYSFLYLKDGQINEYRVFHDGLVKESII
ncbi:MULTISPECIES: hypothetical protein [unclassified Paenibacillus]|uniref:LptM family lipoprotein n=1 Tax=unclassified Paenibacillus TaxID=185978 RepID=UPI001AE8A55A|nr:MULTISPECIES: hypothetical protein [unclassified Paenibacillus]MBP1154370.1 putative small lipoprotein YifL [Paenibacillus sp. PvP091]MBP1170246.1 putative small lipoprotein YifL [Paenibacillus sp. PvR098]MBP2441274.1 putative small lipoprotein YifL [Paenibacillus sp. PvP052]